jgi:hypothetical protein
MPEWEKTESGNVILSYEDFYISYQDFEQMRLAMETVGMPETTAFLRPETALVTWKDKDDFTTYNFYIIKGDLRKEYEEAAAKDGLVGCLDIYWAYQDGQDIFGKDSGIEEDYGLFDEE